MWSGSLKKKKFLHIPILDLYTKKNNILIWIHVFNNIPKVSILIKRWYTIEKLKFYPIFYVLKIKLHKILKIWKLFFFNTICEATYFLVSMTMSENHIRVPLPKILVLMVWLPLKGIIGNGTSTWVLFIVSRTCDPFFFLMKYFSHTLILPSKKIEFFNGLARIKIILESKRRFDDRWYLWELCTININSSLLYFLMLLLKRFTVEVMMVVGIMPLTLRKVLISSLVF